jgi:hypothetical protein
VAAVVGFFAWNNMDTGPVVMQKDPVTGQSVYANTDYGFSVTYSGDWQGPAERIAANPDSKDVSTDAVFLIASSSEAIVIQGKLGDMESFNDFAAVLDSYKMVTVAGLPALRFEYVGAINEEGTIFAKTVMIVFKGLKSGSVTLAYQKMFDTEAKAKKADVSNLDAFLANISFI